MKTLDQITSSDIVSWVETKDNFKALRFEQTIYDGLLAKRSDVQKDIIAKIQSANTCSWHTALMIYASSWGAYQIMGFNLYGVCGYVKSVADFFADDHAFIQSYCYGQLEKSMGLTGMTPRAMAISSQARMRFALRYNGGREYADLIKQALIHFGFQVKD